jgi:60 kDa SS-A/Ro ribonucleoprotein
MSKYAQQSGTRVTSQMQKARPDQVKNSAGGFVFQLDKWKQLERFLILGAEGGTYYVREHDHIDQNVKCLDECANEDPARTVNTIVQISEAGRAPKQTPAIFALAKLSGHTNPEARKLALGALEQVCRTGSFLFDYIRDIEKFRGWGRGLRTAVGNWYLNKEPRDLAYQIVKYQQREGESHADTLRRAHPAPRNEDTHEVLRYAVGKLEVPATWLETGKPHQQVLAAVEAAKHAPDEDAIVRLITDFGLVRECIPTQWLNSPKVWDALLVKMPMHAMLRNLGKMSAIGLLAPLAEASKTVAAAFRNKDAIRKSRLHPLAILIAQGVYNTGHGVKGSLTWRTVPRVTDALDDAFYLAFETVEPTGKNWLLGVDISGSMSSWGPSTGGHLTCAQIACAMAMVTIRTEQNHYCHGFATQFVDLGLSPKMRLDQVVSTAMRHTMGGTDCALPMVHALKHKIPVDVFAVYTDNETWHGGIHPYQALRQYREQMNPKAKLIVMGITSTGFTIADPSDAGMLDVVGFDASAPAVMADFARN